MRLPTVRLLLPIFAAGLAVQAAAGDERLSESRALARAMGQELQSALLDALERGGPAEAIGVCRDVAPDIARDLSRESGASVGRVSRRPRNPANRPEPWQVEVLEGFEREIAAGTEQPEHYAETDGGVRYLLAIRAQPMCLLCHGTALGDDVRAALDEQYPADLATGYEAGDLRGAFSVVWAEE